MFSLRRLFRRFFGPRATLPPRAVAKPRTARPVPRDPADFDLLQGAEYPPEARKELTEEERLRLDVVKAKVTERFRSERIEITVFPSRAAQILRVLDEPDFDIGQLVRIAQNDPAISASILRAANSAAYAGIKRIDNVRDAVMRLGAQTVAGIATAVTARGLFDSGSTRSRFGSVWSHLWLHSVTTAFAAGGFAASTRNGNLEQCFLGGMLHDIGKTFVLRALDNLPEADTKDDFSEPFVAALLEDLHIGFGKATATAWNLPDFVIDACARHHEVPEARSRDLNIIRVVSGLDELCVNPQFRNGLEGEVRQAAVALGLDGFALRALATERSRYASTAASL